MREVRKTSFKKIQGTQQTQEEENIVIESFLELWVEDMQIASFYHSPGFEKELVIGYLITNGILDTPADIDSIDVDARKCSITVKSKSQFVSRFLESMANLLENLPKHTPSNYEIIPENIYAARKKFIGLQKIHDETGGVHGALILDMHSDTSIFVEDIGRFNAVDKAVGIALGSGVDLSECLLLVSGRLTSGMVVKGIRSGISVMISLSVATDLGVHIAIDSGMTLLGSLKENSFWIYNE